MPKVSIGLPVYNGENYVEVAINSLLSQTFRDFELIICDNASTDRTGEICQAAADADPRVRYHRNPTNIGASPNFNLCLEMATGEYFKWSAHDDICHPRFLERCVETLDANPETSVCYTKIQAVDESGEFLADYTMEDGRFSGRDPIDRYVKTISEGHWCFAVFGLMRRSMLEKTNGIGAYVGSDRNLIAQMALQGPLAQVDEVLFMYRDHGSRSVKIDIKERGKWFDPSRANAGRRYFTNLFLENFRILFRMPLTPWQRLRGVAWVSGWAGKRTHLIARELLGLT